MYSDRTTGSASELNEALKISGQPRLYIDSTLTSHRFQVFHKPWLKCVPVDLEHIQRAQKEAL